MRCRQKISRPRSLKFTPRESSLRPRGWRVKPRINWTKTDISDPWISLSPPTTSPRTTTWDLYDLHEALLNSQQKQMTFCSRTNDLRRSPFYHITSATRAVTRLTHKRNYEKGIMSLPPSAPCLSSITLEKKTLIRHDAFNDAPLKWFHGKSKIHHNHILGWLI